MYEENQELDLIEGVDEEGNKVLLQVMEYFFYNGEEYVVLSDAEETDEDGECCCACDDPECEHDHDEEVNLYIMKVITSTEENGEEVEEFVPVDEDLMDKLIQVVQTNFSADDEAFEDEDED
ncbi:MAG: DUF1292 domain-containing protein [Clostridia bacterium]|nr:DUF1292 domain-containing protein [Clostridia bacterium]